jgi:hypothetical protein
MVPVVVDRTGGERPVTVDVGGPSEPSSSSAPDRSDPAPSHSPFPFGSIDGFTARPATNFVGGSAVEVWTLRRLETGGPEDAGTLSVAITASAAQVSFESVVADPSGGALLEALGDFRPQGNPEVVMVRSSPVALWEAQGSDRSGESFGFPAQIRDVYALMLPSGSIAQVSSEGVNDVTTMILLERLLGG